MYANGTSCRSSALIAVTARFIPCFIDRVQECPFALVTLQSDAGLSNSGIAVLFGKHTQRFYRKSELIVRIEYHPTNAFSNVSSISRMDDSKVDLHALVEHPLDTFLLPFSIGALSSHDQLHRSADTFSFRIFSGHQSDDSPACHDHLTLALNVDTRLTTLIPHPILHHLFAC